MDSPDLRAPDSDVQEADPDWIAEVVARLEEDPGECWPAVEGLAELDEETRAGVIDALAVYADRPGVRELLRLLRPSLGTAVAVVGGGAGVAEFWGRPRVIRSVVTGVDGEGRGTIVLSSSDGESRYTAAFRCDVRLGIVDAVGEVEPEQPEAGRPVVEAIDRDDGHAIADVPELALRLLEGCAALAGPGIPEHVRAWLRATAGEMSTSAILRAPDAEGFPEIAIARFAEAILDACPGWRDRAPLTVELAEEIALREGRAVPDPIRDAGAYRYLFEHRLIGRLDLYARMLLWMAWVWQAGGRAELARAAFALAAQLSDQQYVGPSHPFTVALTTRSFLAVRVEGPGGAS